MPPPLSLWPWRNLGNFKYLFYVPFLWRVLYPWIHENTQIRNSWCLHLMILCALRGLVFQLWFSFGNMLFFTRNRRILQKGVDFKQIDREWDWDNFIILQAMIGAMACSIYSSFTSTLLPPWNPSGAVTVLLLHILVSEPLYYYLHKCFHASSYLFSNYHSLHHASVILQSFTAGNATPLEHVALTAVMTLPILGAFVMGNVSSGVIHGYVLMFDFLRCLGHSNVEIVSNRIFEAIPMLKYLIYTPTYHSLHHTEMDTNLCLFMPIYDALGNTLNSKSWDLHKKITSNTERQSRVPDFVFLSHIVDVTAAMHIPCLFRSYSAEPFRTRLFLLPIWPPVAMVVLIISVISKPFLNTFYDLKGRHCQTWAVPKCGFQYFLPFARKGINDRIEQAILTADKLGVKVINLAALNKNETLNGGGSLFVDKHPDLKVRVVHGNTLTAAVILHEIPPEVAEVFLSAATSKLGRAIALYLCRKKVRVLMLTSSAERFQNIQKEAPAEFQSYLVRVTNFKAAQKCKTWVVGKWITPREQNWAPPGTHFHQFVVPSILPFRRDCTYGEPAAMKLPDDVEGLGCCEYSMGRGIVHACHAGGVVHMLEGWTHHEVGGIDVDNIDRAWIAALKHGFKPVSTIPKHKSQ